MAITAGVGAGAIGGGMAVQSYFSNKSASATRKAQAAAAEQMRQARNQAIGYQMPYEAAGRGGLNVLSGLLTGNQYDAQGNISNTLGNDQRNALFKTSPGYQFRVDQAMKNAQSSQAAHQGLLSGGAMKELSDYSSGMASDEYGNYVNQLQGLAGIGQNAATNMGNYAINAGGQIANYTQQGGMAAANNYAQQGSIIGGGLSQLGGGLLGAGLSGSSKTGGNYNNSSNYNNNVFSGYNMPNTTLSGGNY